MPGATRSIVIKASIDRLFTVITDYQRYPEFLPEVKGIRISKRQGRELDVQYEVEVLKRIRYTLHLIEEPPNRISWTFVEGELMRDNRGHWLLEPAGEGTTRATYSIEMRLGPLVPKSIVNALVDSSLPKMLEGFKKRAESIA
jgi:coenzyme Q-binding protein COQ10